MAFGIGQAKAASLSREGPHQGYLDPGDGPAQPVPTEGDAPTSASARREWQFEKNEGLNRGVFQPKATPEDEALSNELNRGGTPFDVIEKNFYSTKTPSLD